MAEKGRWIEIVGWDRFQHYSDRDPIWIKNYTALIDNPAYRGLTAGQRALLHGLWLLYAKSHREVRLDTGSVQRQLDLRTTSAQLEALNHAGFIRFRASKPLASRYPRRREEKRRKRNKEELKNGPVERDPEALKRIRELAEKIGKPKP
jgi:hypothetical protein